MLMWWVIINKWKSDINGKPKWKPIRGWSHQHFVKMFVLIALFLFYHSSNKIFLKIVHKPMP